eukprot:SAG31_NODE_8094_length_1524_cov_1.600000_2_plen_87_part_00
MGAVDAEVRSASEQTYDGFISSNYMRTQRDCGLSPDELVILALNSFKSSFLNQGELDVYAKMVSDHCSTWNQLAQRETDKLVGRLV